MKKVGTVLLDRPNGACRCFGKLRSFSEGSICKSLRDWDIALSRSKAMIIPLMVVLE